MKCREKGSARGPGAGGSRDVANHGEVLEYAGTGIEMAEHMEARLKLDAALEENQHLRDELQSENLALREEVAKATGTQPDHPHTPTKS